MIPVNTSTTAEEGEKTNKTTPCKANKDVHTGANGALPEASPSSNY